jgi:hypothetical protein
VFPPGADQAAGLLPPPEDVVPLPLADGKRLPPEEPDASWHQDFHGLLHIGRLSRTFEWTGHKIVIHTLNSDELLIAARLCAPWGDTIGATRAYAQAMAALCVDLIDGIPLPTPLGEHGPSDAWAHQRFDYAGRWFAPTIDAIYNEYESLELRVKQVLEEMGKASAPEDGSSVSASSPAPAGSSGAGLSPESS